MDEANFETLSRKETIFERIKSLKFPIGSYVVVGGVLEAHGIRESNDIDIIATDELFDRLVKEGWPEYTLNPWDRGVRGTKRKVSKNSVDIMTEFSWRGTIVADTVELIEGAEIIEGIPFASLQALLEWKKISEREKDAEDVKLIKNYLENNQQ